MGHLAIPVSGSVSRKLAQPLVRQNARPAAVDWLDRRRIRRMELERPAKVVVAERVIMVIGTRGSFCAPDDVGRVVGSTTGWMPRTAEVEAGAMLLGPGGEPGALV